MKIGHFLFIIALLCGLYSCKEDKKDYPAYGGISGYVTNSVSGEPVDGCLVTLGDNKTEVTESDGQFRFINIEPGEMLLNFNKDGYTDATQTIKVIAGETTIVNIKMTPSLAKMPNKAVFFGNSLLTGFGFGMAASSPGKDYYSIVTDFIKSKNPDFESEKYAAHTFEGVLNKLEIDSEIHKIFLDRLTGQEDLVVVQLGDNVYSDERLSIFSESCFALCKSIKEKCPDATVAWVGLWYYRTKQFNVITEACEATGCKLISINQTNTTENQAKVGQVVDLGVSGSRKCENIVSVTESDGNFPKDITVTFSVGETEYQSTLTVNSYSIDNKTLNYSSNFMIIDSAGVATHPNDKGFREIADIIISELFGGK
ncbi:hypothetical protein E4T81_08655 [Barnesiella sp. WM24]|uniref:carboxypeptidase regulatory-like domain-containing protein n=1 Tax=Barnesiella sp. WM24 TaxID=2558278 RepID=UPI001071B4DF|nr:carboxypeptidase regulatory-like domain-containing protein [Barnesiella sp. WM24]TFU93027.1 hypothetical protein E4T81_08655 [Barnesiella sp. WM24]